MAVTVPFTSIAKMSSSLLIPCAWWSWRIFRNRKIGEIRGRLRDRGVVPHSAVHEWMDDWVAHPDATPEGNVAKASLDNQGVRDEIERALFALVQDCEPPPRDAFLARCAAPFVSFHRMLFPFSVNSQERETLEKYGWLITARLSRSKPQRRAGEQFQAGRDTVQLERLLEMSSSGECWRGMVIDDDDRPGTTPTRAAAYRTICFFTAPAAQAHLAKSEARIQDDIRQLKDVDSIVRPIYLGKEGDTPFIVTEYLPGGTLKSWLMTNADRRVALNKKEIFHGLAAALAAAHKEQIYHCLLDPGQIMLTVPFEPGRVVDHVRAKISYFGMSRLAGASAPAMYVSPEAGEYDERTAEQREAQGDVFALGVIWYQLLIDDEELERPPYDFYKRLSEYEQSTRDRLEKCLAHPESRWKDAVALKADLDGAPPPRTLAHRHEHLPPDDCFDVWDLVQDYLIAQAAHG
jgi:serine/threonine protein kinase